jgi:hypothetical protein
MISSFHMIKFAHSPTGRGSIQFDEPVWMDPHQYRQICEDSSSQAAFARAAEWLAYCVKHDPGCAQPDQNYVPRRLVNVNLGNEALHPFLEEPTAPKKYACLSYCWGPDSDDVVRTTKNNIEAHLPAIPIQSMPASLQDAVKVCRRLDIPYLWVDSLCILQGHRDEWLHDSAKMDLTYLNSHLTIAALEPASCKSGFLGQQLYGTRLNFKDRDKHWSKRWAIDPYSLNSRGWCLQEEVLPNRRLRFNGLEMSWECQCRRVCECGHLLQPGVNERTLSQTSDIVTLGSLLKKPTMTGERPQDTMANFAPQSAYWKSSSRRFNESMSMRRSRETWRQLVSKYTRRRLSYRRDKLAALEGLTKLAINAIQLEDGCPDQFLAGLWKKEIHLDLAWSIEHPQASSTDLSSCDDAEDTYCGPSWSWVSSDWPIKYECCEGFWLPPRTPLHFKSPHATERCEFISAEYVTELAEDPTGPVLQARIRLKGALISVELGMLETIRCPEDLDDSIQCQYSSERNGNVFVQTKDRLHAWVSMDTPVHPNIKLDDKNISCWLEARCNRGCCLLSKNDQTQYYCFRLFSWVSEWVGKETWFLLLKQSSKGDFRRVGVGRQKIHRDFYAKSLFKNSKEETIDII